MYCKVFENSIQAPESLLFMTDLSKIEQNVVMFHVEQSKIF